MRNEYWRFDTNSTDVIRCPRPQSCKGGFEPDQQHPVKCETGYTGAL